MSKRESIGSAAASIMSNLRKHKRGREKVLGNCPYCKRLFGRAERRLHIPRCKKKPADPVAARKIFERSGITL